jgi:hypothetical protein
LWLHETSGAWIPLMPKQVKKTVRPREERLAAIGDPKTPKMGGITPKAVEVPEVDDLLSKMRKVSAPKSIPLQYVSFDLGTEEFVRDHCNHGCSCGPCRRGVCGNCTVDAQRNADRDTVRAYVARYRGIELP